MKLTAARRTHQATSVAFLATGVFLVYQGQVLGYSGRVGPGPGFFAFWIGVALTVVSVLRLIQVSTRGPSGVAEDLVPSRAGAVRVLSIIAALVGFAFLLTPLGFNLTMLGFLLFTLFAFDREHAVLKSVIAFTGSFGVHYILETLLQVTLPDSSIEILRNVGL